jgi:hypothetical protein
MERILHVLEEVNEIQDYQSWYKEMRHVDTQERVWQCKAHRPKKVVVKGVVPPPMMFSTTNDREVGRYDGYDVKYTQKLNAEQVKSLALFMVDKVKCHIPKHQQLIMEIFLCQGPTMLLGATRAPLDHFVFEKKIL